MFNVVWCSYWDNEIDEPGGFLRDLGSFDTWAEAEEAQFCACLASRFWDFPAGIAVITDANGRRVTSETPASSLLGAPWRMLCACAGVLWFALESLWHLSLEACCGRSVHARRRGRLPRPADEDPLRPER